MREWKNPLEINHTHDDNGAGKIPECKLLFTNAGTFSSSPLVLRIAVVFVSCYLNWFLMLEKERSFLVNYEMINMLRILINNAEICGAKSGNSDRESL